MGMPNIRANTSGHAAAEPSAKAGGRLSMAEALFSATQRRVLGLLFGQPERSFYATEIIELVGAGSGAVQRELKKLADSGLARVSRKGNQKHYQANSEAPIFAELAALIRKTVGLIDPLRAALDALRDDIGLALVYGSVAKGNAGAHSDVDVLLVSDTLTLEAVYAALEPAEKALSRPINPTLYTRKEFDKRLSSGNSFLQRTLAGDVIVLVGELPDGARGAR